MRFVPYSSTKTFRSPLTMNECLRRIGEETAKGYASPGLALGGWKPLAINKHIVRKVSRNRFKLQLLSIPSAGTAAWEVQGELRRWSDGVWIECSFRVRSIVRLMMLYWIMFAVLLVIFGIYRIAAGDAHATFIISLVSMAAVSVIGSMLLSLPPRAVRRSVEPQLYAAVQRLFEAEEVARRSVSYRKTRK